MSEFNQLNDISRLQRVEEAISDSGGINYLAKHELLIAESAKSSNHGVTIRNLENTLSEKDAQHQRFAGQVQKFKENKKLKEDKQYVELIIGKNYVITF